VFGFHLSFSFLIAVIFVKTILKYDFLNVIGQATVFVSAFPIVALDDLLIDQLFHDFQRYNVSHEPVV